jgi:hypothetical protein
MIRCSVGTRAGRKLQRIIETATHLAIAGLVSERECVIEHDIHPG